MLNSATAIYSVKVTIKCTYDKDKFSGPKRTREDDFKKLTTSKLYY